MIKQFTRFWPGQPPSIVDQIWTNSPNSIMSTANSVRAFSDHNVVSSIIRTKDRKEQTHEVLKRNRSKIDVKNYQSKIQKIDWTEFYMSRDINQINDIFETEVGKYLKR